MPAPRNRANLYILLIAVLVAAVAAYYLPTKRPENTSTLSPKEYIGLAEQKKAQRLRYEQEQREMDRQQETARPATN